MAVLSPWGDRLIVTGRKPGAPTDRRTVSRLRFEDWRIMHDEGMPAPNGRRVRRSLEEIARLYGVTRQAVHKGVRIARRRREAIREIALLSEPA